MSRGRRWLRYAGWATAVVAAVVLLLWPWLDGDGRRGLLLAGGIALPLQLAVFALQVTRDPGSPGFFGAWVAGIVFRLAALGTAALWVNMRDDVSALAALLTLAGLLFFLLLLEPLGLREPDNRTRTGQTRR